MVDRCPYTVYTVYCHMVQTDVTQLFFFFLNMGFSSIFLIIFLFLSCIYFRLYAPTGEVISCHLSLASLLSPAHKQGLKGDQIISHP